MNFELNFTPLPSYISPRVPEKGKEGGKKRKEKRKADRERSAPVVPSPASELRFIGGLLRYNKCFLSFSPPSASSARPREREEREGEGEGASAEREDGIIFFTRPRAYRFPSRRFGDAVRGERKRASEREQEQEQEREL